MKGFLNILFPQILPKIEEDQMLDEDKKVLRWWLLSSFELCNDVDREKLLEETVRLPLLIVQIFNLCTCV